MVSLTISFGFWGIHTYVGRKICSVFFTYAELRRFHRHFGHPNAGKLFKFLSNSGFPDMNSSIRQMILQSERLSAPCQVQRPRRFRFTLREDVNFKSTEISWNFQYWKQANPSCGRRSNPVPGYRLIIDTVIGLETERRAQTRYYWTILMASIAKLLKWRIPVSFWPYRSRYRKIFYGPSASSQLQHAPYIQKVCPGRGCPFDLNYRSLPLTALPCFQYDSQGCPGLGYG